jgi:hypothetical protein
MTGQIAFARTLRALDADNFRAPKMGLFFAIVLLAAWTWWLFTARIPQYEVTTKLELSGNSAEAIFPRTTTIHPGQPAQITLTDGQILEARVEKVTNEPTGVRIHFNLSSTLLTPSPQPPAPARATVEVDPAAPATIVLHVLHR